MFRHIDRDGVELRLEWVGSEVHAQIIGPDGEESYVVALPSAANGRAADFLMKDPSAGGLTIHGRKGKR